MAEAFLLDTSRDIIGTLGSLAIKELGVWWNYKDELKKLENTVATVQAVLLDAEEERQPSHQFKLWLRTLRTVLYDAEELVDDFSTEVLRRRVISDNKMNQEARLFFSWTSNRFIYGLRMGHRIKEIREALNAIANDRQKFHFAVRPAKTFENISEGRDSVVLFKHQRDAILKVERDVFGRDNDKRNILSLLKADDYMVIPIVGSGGLGKTTLARLIFDDDETKTYFDLRIWVSVGDVDFSVDEIAEKAFKSAIAERKVKGGNIGKKRTEGDGTQKLRKTYNDRIEEFYMGGGGGEEEEEKGDKEVEVEVEFDNREKFRKIIRRKRILLVLDDVWSEDRNKWVDLENLWKEDGAIGSRVLLTTRSLIVAKMTGNPKPYQLGFLSSEDSCSLFKKIVFGKKEPLNQDVEKNVEIIVLKCGGVPLAIKIIANLLYSLNPETEWLPYVSSELSKYPQANNNIFPTLQLSYHHLPSPLKYCFAYCKIFPKGYEISVRMLIQLWVALGYIRASDMVDQSLEDTGMQFCKVLLARSFFQNEVVDDFGNLISVKMHDIMYELASYIGGADIVFSNPLGKDVNTNTRHLSYGGLFSRSLAKILSSSLEVKKLWTFVSMDCEDMFESGGHRIQARECGEILEKMKSIRVLDLHKSNLEAAAKDVLEHVGKLKHLRYLDLSLTKIKKLPKSITKLQNLQVLNIKNCVELDELPNDIRKLVSLRFLDCEGCDNLTYTPTGLNCLTSLHTLTKFVGSSVYPSEHGAGLDELSSLSQLKTLVIENLRNVHFQGFKGGNLKDKKHLRVLSLSWYADSFEDEQDSFEDELQKLEPPPTLEQLFINTYQGVKFHNWFSGLKNLVGIKFEGCKKCQHLPPLSQLFCLKVISISGCNDLTYVEDERSHGGVIFPSLKHLVLKNCPKLERWWKSEDNADDYPPKRGSAQFRCLSVLSISGCPKFTSMPLFPTLDEELFLERTSIRPLEQTMKTDVSVSTTITTSSSLVYPLSKLKKLAIWRNAELSSLPEEWMVQLTTLQTLDLRYCPYLSGTCGNENGADWHKISHISNITVGNKTIQKEGRYQLNDPVILPNASHQILHQT